MPTLPSVEEIEELLLVATDDEKVVLTNLLDLKLSLESPLAYAMRNTPGTVPFAHAQFLDQYLVALVEHSLYPIGSEADLLRPDLPDGISDQAVWVELGDQDDEEEKAGRFEHPETGEECAYNLAISEPPQHGKSFLVSHHLPAWFLTKYPDRPAALVSYEEDFATTWTYKVRTLIEQHPEYGIELDPSTRGKGEWKLKGHEGGMLAAGVGGPITGRPTGLLVMDDLIKNSEEALSEATTKHNTDWWHTTGKTRNQSPRKFPDKEPWAGVRVLMHTRWSQNDLIGYTQRTEPGEWVYINLPAISEGTNPDLLPEGHKPDPLGRPAGRALAPMLHSIEVLNRLKDSGDPDEPGSGGAFWFEAMYQGYPSVEGMGIFSKPFAYFEKRSNKLIFGDGYVCYTQDLRHFVTVDLAASKKTRADFTVFGEFGQAPDGRLVVLDWYRDRLETPDHLPTLKAWVKKKARMMFVGIENKTFGQALIQHLMRMPGLMPIRAIEADTDKVARAIPAGLACRNKMVWFDANSPLRKVVEAELLAFDSGAHDDIVDVLSYAVQEWEKLPRKHPSAPPTGNKPEDRVKRHRLAKIKQKNRKRNGRHPQMGRM